MPDPEIPVEGAVEGGRYRAVSDLPPAGSTSTPPTTTTPVTTPPTTPGGDDVVGAEPEAVRRAATELGGLGDELGRWAEATAGLRLELGPQGRRDDDEGGGAEWAPARPGPRAVPVAEPLEVPGLAERRRRVHAELVGIEELEPRRFAAQESERALHALADVWQRGLSLRADGLHETAAQATGTAEQMDAAGNL